MPKFYVEPKVHFCADIIRVNLDLEFVGKGKRRFFSFTDVVTKSAVVLWILMVMNRLSTGSRSYATWSSGSCSGATWSVDSAELKHIPSSITNLCTFVARPDSIGSSLLSDDDFPSQSFQH